MKNTNLFTFVMDWKGGTYLSQVSDISLNKAISKWVDNLDIEEISDKNFEKIKFDVDVTDEVAEPVDGLKNVWCISPDINDVMAIVHIIKTNT